MDRKRRLMENNNGWPLRSQLFDGAPFRLPLTHTAVPASAASGTTATFTRATTGSVQDHEGVLRTAIAGEARFTGARRVRNLLATSSEDFSVTTGISLNATPTVNSVVFTNASAYRYKRTIAATGTTLLCSCKVKSADGSKGIVGVRAYGVSSGSAAFESVNLTTEYQRITVKITGATLSEAIDFGLENRVGNGGDGTTTGTVQITEIFVEDITGRADQTTPSEYVSVGVESAPYYHGSGVDGVRAYPYDLSGNPIPSTTLLGYSAEGARTNLCLQSNAFTTTWTAAGTPSVTQNAIGPDGATSAWTLTDNAAGTPENIYQGITLTAAAYTGSVFVAKTVGAQSSYPVLFFYPADGTQVQAATVDTTNGVITDWTSVDSSTMASGRSVRIVSFNDDFWRVELTKTGTAAVHFFQFFPAGATTATYAGPIVSTAAQGSAVFYGAQVELGSCASSYIPTTTIAVARDGEIDSVPTASNITAAAGWISCEFTPNHAPSGTVFLWGTYVDASNYTAILHDATNLIFRKRIAGVNYDATIVNAFVLGTTYKMAASWGAAGTSIYLNGTAGTGHANTTAAQIGTTMQWGADGNSLQQPGMALRNNRIGQRQLSSSELQAITA